MGVCKSYKLFFLGCCIVPASHYAVAQQKIMLSNAGKVAFVSNAKLEIIKANSQKLKGAIDKTKNSFAFSVDMKSFEGFNSDLQKQHFNEDYIQTDKYPTANFSGKFIESIDYNAIGKYTVRAKGMFEIHGVKQERIIKGILEVTKAGLAIHANFIVALEDHNIKVPKIVNEKIAETIKVDVDIPFKQ